MPVVKCFSAYQSTQKTSIIIIKKPIVFERELLMNRAFTTRDESGGWALIFFLLVTSR